MEETLKQKQLFLRENILDKGYSTDNFMDLLHSKKGEQGLDLNNWTMRELSSVVKEFISYENPHEEEDDNPKEKSDEMYEQECMMKYKEQKQKENQEYGLCSKIEKSRLNQNGDNIKIKVSLPKNVFNKDNDYFLVETFPLKYQVKRNANDFEWFLNYLNDEFINYVIPKISNKNYGDKYTEEKALKKSRNFKKFLDDIILNPTLKHIKIFADFLSINSEEDFIELKKKYSSKKTSEKKDDNLIKLEAIKTLSGKTKISINKEKEVYYMNIKDITKINETILQKINKSYKNLISAMQSTITQMKEISELWKLLYDKSLKYYDTSYTTESYKTMNKLMEELINCENIKISIINTNIREYFRFIKNEFHAMNDLANKVENYKDKYYKAFEKLNEDKEKMFKEQDINSWGLNEEDMKHKDIFIKNKELAFSKILPEESRNVYQIKTIYGTYLNSLIDEYERIRLLNGKKNKMNTIQTLNLYFENFKNTNNSFSNYCTNLIKVKDEEIEENNYLSDNNNNQKLFNEKTNNEIHFNNNRQNNNYSKFQNTKYNNADRINNNQINRNDNQYRKNNQLNLNNNNQDKRNINENNRPNNQGNYQYNRNNIQLNSPINNQLNRNNENLYEQNRNYRNNNHYEGNRNINNRINIGNNNNYQNNRMNRNDYNQNENNRNNQINIGNNQNNRNFARNNNNESGFYNNRNNERNDFYNDEDEYDFKGDRNNNINIYEF